MTEPKEDNKPRHAFVARDGKLVPFDYEAALRLAQQAHLLAAGIAVPGITAPASAPQDR